MWQQPRHPRKQFGSTNSLETFEVIPRADKATTLYYDSSMAIAKTKESRHHKRQNISIKDTISLEYVMEGVVDVCKIAFEDNIVNLFTKTWVVISFESRDGSLWGWGHTGIHSERGRDGGKHLGMETRMELKSYPQNLVGGDGESTPHLALILIYMYINV